MVEETKAEQAKAPALRLGDVAPDFSVDSTDGTINFHEWGQGSWVVLFSHPKDYTPVCTTELGYVCKIKPDFDKRGVKVIGLSVDSLEEHRGWIKDIEETQGVTFNYPLIADGERKVAELYGMLHPAEAMNLVLIRSCYVIDPNHKIRLTINYPPSTGRNFDELMRVIDSLQLTDKHKLATPANWKQGEDCIILPTVKNEEAETLFPGFNQVKPYLRYTPDPTK